MSPPKRRIAGLCMKMQARPSAPERLARVVWLKPRETHRANPLGLPGLLAGCLLHADLGAISSDASAVAEREGSAWRGDGQKIAHFLFCFGCHLNRWPQNVRTNKHYSRQAGSQSTPLRSMCSAVLHVHQRGVLPHAAASRAQRFLWSRTPSATRRT